MLKNLKSPEETRPALYSLLGASSTLAGICIALVGVLQNKASIGSMADDMLLLAGLVFLSVCYLVFFALRHLDSPAIARLTTATDVVFLCSLTMVVLSGFVITYQLF